MKRSPIVDPAWRVTPRRLRESVITLFGGEGDTENELPDEANQFIGDMWVHMRTGSIFVITGSTARGATLWQTLTADDFDPEAFRLFLQVVPAEVAERIKNS